MCCVLCIKCPPFFDDDLSGCQVPLLPRYWLRKQLSSHQVLKCQDKWRPNLFFFWGGNPLDEWMTWDDMTCSAAESLALLPCFDLKVDRTDRDRCITYIYI